MDIDKEDLIGNAIECQGVKATIKEVYYAAKWDGLWDIEFRDTNGVLRHWKQECDGGQMKQSPRK